MTKKATLNVLALILMAVLSAAHVCAGDLIVSIKQPFKAGGKDYPAGHYRIVASRYNDHCVDLINLDTKANDEIPFISRLSPREGEWGKVVFDKVGDELYLAQVFVVGLDGYSFQVAPGRHRHVVVKEDILGYHE